MARWGVVVGLGIAAFVALAFATEDMCSSMSQLPAIAVIAVFIGAVAWMSLRRRFRDRPWMPWLWAVAAGAAGFMLLLVAFIAYFGAECSR